MNKEKFQIFKIPTSPQMRKYWKDFSSTISCPIRRWRVAILLTSTNWICRLTKTPLPQWDSPENKLPGPRGLINRVTKFLRLTEYFQTKDKTPWSCIKVPHTSNILPVKGHYELEVRLTELHIIQSLISMARFY